MNGETKGVRVIPSNNTTMFEHHTSEFFSPILPTTSRSRPPPGHPPAAILMAESDPMSSGLKSETARVNGAKSHGPVTPQGKARSSANSRRHGLTASVLLDGESDEHFQLLLADFMDQFQPRTGVETGLVEMMAIARWRLRRLLAIETHLFELEMVRRRKQINAEFPGIDHDSRLAFAFQKMSDTGNSLALLIRYEGSLNRSYDKALKQLHQLQSSRQNRPAKETLGSFGISEPQAPAAERGTGCNPWRQPGDSIGFELLDHSSPEPRPESPQALLFSGNSNAPSSLGGVGTQIQA
jgi:hypothetical protein